MKKTNLLVLIALVACAPGTEPQVETGVRIVRDEFGVPHIYADSIFGLHYGYGYAVAQDRLFQMEMARRSTQGLVAEVLGAEYVDYDRNARTLFDPASIRRQMEALPQADADIFEGFAEGMNAWIDAIREKPESLLPRQFTEFDMQPVNWTAYDVAMIFIGTMNNRYGDFNTELENAEIYLALVSEHGEETALQIFNALNPRFTDDAPTTIPTTDWSVAAPDALATSPAVNLPAALIETASAITIRSGFSNCYVLGKEKVDGANSILVNGPQFGWFAPSYVYSVGMHGAGIDVVGNTPFAYPVIMFGHNERISWGSTWGASDIVDMFELLLNPDNAGEYFYKGEYRAFESRVEEISVRDEEPETLTILRSVHGPVIRMDELRGIAVAKKRSWDGGEMATMMSWINATRAENFADWKAEAEKSAINVNMYYADVDGNAGYFHGGWFPQRIAGHDNRFPASGDGDMDWGGRQPITDSNPHVLNPSSGFVANWNNKPGNGVMNPDFFFYSWSSADRVDYLNNALAGADRFTPDEAWALLETSSYADLYAPYFLPAIQDAVAETDDATLVEAAELLSAWNRQSVDANADGKYDQRATAIFRTFVETFYERTLSDDLGDAWPFFAASGYPRAGAPTGAGTNLSPGIKALAEAVAGRGGYDFFNGEPRDAAIREALQSALEQTNGALLDVAERPFSTSNFLGIPQASTREAGLLPIEQNRGTENNMIVMSPGAIVGWEVAPPGQSGFIAPDGSTTEHYDDQLAMYHEFGRKRMWFYPRDVEANKQNEVTVQYQD